MNYAVILVRPAGAGWSSIHDMLKYVEMELGEGVLPDGKRYISKDALLARRVPQVPIGKDVTYGMGLMVDTTYGVPVVHHGGDLIGFHSDMIWLPDQNVGSRSKAFGRSTRKSCSSACIPKMACMNRSWDTFRSNNRRQQLRC